MKKIAATMIVMLMSATAAAAQNIAPGRDSNIPHTEFSLGYDFVRSNAPPGGCGCFHWQGGSFAGKIGVAPQWSVAGSVAGFHADHQGTSSLQPTMVMYLAGIRRDIVSDRRRLVPFAEAMAGGAYATNGYFVTATSAASPAIKIGGGIDVSLGGHWALRPINVDYLWTHFANGSNDRQNNLQLNAGIVYRLHRK